MLSDERKQAKKRELRAYRVGLGIGWNMGISDNPKSFNSAMKQASLDVKHSDELVTTEETTNAE